MLQWTPNRLATATESRPREHVATHDHHIGEEDFK